jgi:hypothetical protein
MPHPPLSEIATETARRFCPRQDCQLNITPTTMNAHSAATIYRRDGGFSFDDYTVRYQNSILCQSCDRRYTCTTHFHQTNYTEVT